MKEHTITTLLTFLHKLRITAGWQPVDSPGIVLVAACLCPYSCKNNRQRTAVEVSPSRTFT